MSIEREPDPAKAMRGHPRTREYVRESHALHRRADLGPDFAASLHAWQLLFASGGCFTGLTSARVRGWWLPPLPDSTPLFMAMGLDDPRPMRAGVRTSRHTRPVAHEDLEGLRCADAPETLLACARWLSLIDLVVLIDCVLHTGQCEVADIEAVIRPRRPGTRELKRALAFADGRSESPYETLLRLLHVFSGVDVEPQHAVRDAHGNDAAYLDLLIVGTRGAPEYDGDEHEKAPRRVKDRRRDRMLEELGFVRRGYTAGDVLHRGVGVLKDADRSLGRPHDPSRLRPWLDELRLSLFTPAGAAAFTARATPCLPARQRGAKAPDSEA